MTDHVPRNARMAECIGAAPVRSPFSFVIAGDSGAWPDPTADAIFVQLLRQIADLRPAPVFFAHLGDFAGPGTVARHEHYLELASRLEIPNVCLIGNHDLEDPVAAAAWRAVHGPRNFHFAYGTTRFVAIDGASGQAGDLGDTTPPDTAGPSVEALAYLDETLAATAELNRVVLLHAPPHLGGHYAPQPECGFRQGEPEFLDIVRRHGVLRARPRLRPPHPRRHPVRHVRRRRSRAVSELPQRRSRPRRALPRGRDHAGRARSRARPRPAGVRCARQPAAVCVRGLVVGVWGPPLLVHALAETTPAGDTHPMPEKGLFAIAVAVGVALWAVGAWQVFDSNTTLGALLVLAGAVIVIARPRAARCEYTPTALRNWPVVR
jgi:calcineurin-like phosphoesterase family protein